MRSIRQSALIGGLIILTAALMGCGGNDTGLTIASPDGPAPPPVVVASHGSPHNDMIDAANGPTGDHATGLVTRIGTAGIGPDGSSLNPAPNVDVSARWPNEATNPTLSVSLERNAFGPFRRILPSSVSITSSTPGNAIPDLGGKWNGELLKREVSQGGRTVYTAVYSDIERATITGGGTAYIDLRANPGSNPDGKAGPELRDTSGQIVGMASEIQEVDGRGLTRDLPPGELLTTGEIIRIGGKDYRIFDSYSEWTRPVRIRESIEVTLLDIDKGTAVQADLVCVNGRPGAATDSCEAVRRTEVGSVEGLWKLSLKTEDPIKDKAYLSLGVWLSLPDMADGRFDVGAFAEGNMPSARAALDALTGTARYEGPATGIWAKGVYPRPRASTDGRPSDCDCPVVGSTEVGAFSAQTHLWADFGTATDAPVVDGYVDTFTDENGTSLGKWFVQLDPTALPDPDADATTLFNGMTSGEADGRVLAGQWGVRFFKRTPNESDALHPGYAAGTFSASTVDENTPLDLNALHIIGAFGTEKQ